MGIARRGSDTKVTSKTFDTKEDYIGERFDIHPAIYKYFNIDDRDNVDFIKMKTISDWVLNKNKDIEPALNNLRNLELKLSSAKDDNFRIDQLYNWIRVSDSINNIDNPTSDLKKLYKKAKKEYKLNATDKAYNLMNRIEKEMDETRSENGSGE